MVTKSRPNSQEAKDGTGARFYLDPASDWFQESILRQTWTDTVTYGENIPGWRQLLRDGGNATTSLSGERTTVRFKSGHIRASRKTPVSGQLYEYYVNGLCRITPDNPAGINISAIDEAKANSQALGKFAERILDAKSAIQGGVVIGELAQTLAMIRNPAQGLRGLVDLAGDTLRDIRSARRLGTLKQHMRAVSENLADAWLEYSFGWKPLLNDIKNGDLALHKLNIGQSLSTKRITSSSTVHSNPQEFTTTRSESVLSWNTTRKSVDGCQVIYRGAVRMEARNPGRMDPELFGFSPEQFLPTAWELLPYSFLIDYFVNIDSVIAGWSTLFTNLAWSNKTTRKWTQVDHMAKSDQSMISPLWTLSQNVPATSITKKTSVARAKYEGTYVPDLVFSIPGFGSRKWLNIAALIANRNGDRNWFYD